MKLTFLKHTTFLLQIIVDCPPIYLYNFLWLQNSTEVLQVLVLETAHFNGNYFLFAPVSLDFVLYIRFVELYCHLKIVRYHRTASLRIRLLYFLHSETFIRVLIFQRLPENILFVLHLYNHSVSIGLYRFYPIVCYWAIDKIFVEILLTRITLCVPVLLLQCSKTNSNTHMRIYSICWHVYDYL